EAWHGLKAGVRELISRWLKDRRVKGAGYAVASIGPSIKDRAMMHGRDGAVLFESGLRLHQHRMPATVTIENFLACQTDLHRAAGDHREFGDHDLVIEWIALTPEASSIRSRNDADVACRELKDFGQVPM